MKDQYPFDSYPDYASGQGVLFGQQILDFVHIHKKSMFRYRVEDVAVGIWLQDFKVPFKAQSMPVDNYSYSIHPESVWVNPINSAEMYDLHEGKNFVPRICVDTCLCLNGPSRDPDVPCKMTWSEFSVVGYQDVIPRFAAYN